MTTPYKTVRKGNKVIHYFANCICNAGSNKGLTTYKGDEVTWYSLNYSGTMLKAHRRNGSLYCVLPSEMTALEEWIFDLLHYTKGNNNE